MTVLVSCFRVTIVSQIDIQNGMNKSVYFRLNDEEFAKLEQFCSVNERTKSDVLRELVRSLNLPKKP